MLLQRLGKIVGALAQLVEQPRVLDGDDGLGGEVLYQLDLLFGERPHLLTVYGEGADNLAVLEHGTDYERPRAGGIDERHDALIAIAVASVLPKVGDMDDLFGIWRYDRAAGRRAVKRMVSRRQRSTKAGCAVRRGSAIAVALTQEQIAEFGLTDTGRIRQHCVETQAPARRASLR